MGNEVVKLLSVQKQPFRLVARQACIFSGDKRTSFLRSANGFESGPVRNH